jgi:glycosyltransferase involved in cell wall biosynthesis
MLDAATSAMRQADVAQAAASPLSVAIYMHDLGEGGAERQCLTLAGELAARGLAVTLVVHQLRGELCPAVPPGLPVVDLASPRTLADLPRLAGYLRRARPDVLLANVDHNNIAALLARMVSGTRTKVVICQHNALSPAFSRDRRWTYRLVQFGYRLLAPLAGAAVAVSDGLAAELASAGIPRRKIHTINNAAIDAGFAGRAAEDITHPWFGRPDCPAFVTVGRLVAEKDHATLLAAFALHLRTAPARLLILGDGPLRAELERQADALGIAAAVAFLGSRSNPLPYVRQADAFVLASRSEGFGNVIVEALGCGTPVIAADCQYGPGEILDRGRYGMLVPPEDPAALAAALATVSGLRARWPAAALRERAAGFSAAACAMRYEALFRALRGAGEGT